jgi:F0F1-type ATP synthase epsilon subunit
MGENLRLRVVVVTPNGPVLDEEAIAVTAFSEELGEFCVLPEHRPILSALSAGRLVVEHPDGGSVDFVTDNGFFEGGPRHANIITQRCVRVSDIDLSEVVKEVEKIEKELSGFGEGDAVWDDINVNLEWARARRDAAGGGGA